MRPGENNEFLVTVKDVAEILSLSTREIWRMEAEGAIPKAVRITKKTVRWKGSEIEAYVQNLKPLSS